MALLEACEGFDLVTPFAPADDPKLSVTSCDAICDAPCDVTPRQMTSSSGTASSCRLATESPPEAPERLRVSIGILNTERYTFLPRKCHKFKKN